MFARDLIWKFLFFICSIVLIFGVVAWLVQDLRKFQWQGPELTPSNPILLVMALGELWRAYSGAMAWAAFGVFLGVALLWIAFEALFRGGPKHIWLYASSRVASAAVMGSAVILLAALSVRGGIQSGILSAIVLLGLWLMVSIAETLVRRNAMQLLAADLLLVLGAMGSILGIHISLTAAAVATASIGASLLLQASRPDQFLAAAFLTLVAILLWTIVHSYLLVVRYSTIDIMRGNVVDL